MTLYYRHASYPHTIEWRPPEKFIWPMSGPFIILHPSEIRVVGHWFRKDYEYAGGTIELRRSPWLILPPPFRLRMAGITVKDLPPALLSLQYTAIRESGADELDVNPQEWNFEIGRIK